jgi:hypothetical protein
MTALTASEDVRMHTHSMCVCIHILQGEHVYAVCVGIHISTSAFHVHPSPSCPPRNFVMRAVLRAPADAARPPSAVLMPSPQPARAHRTAIAASHALKGAAPPRAIIPRCSNRRGGGDCAVLLGRSKDKGLQARVGFHAVALSDAHLWRPCLTPTRTN